MAALCCSAGGDCASRFVHGGCLESFLCRRHRWSETVPSTISLCQTLGISSRGREESEGTGRAGR